MYMQPLSTLFSSSCHLHLSPQIAWSPAGILATLGYLAAGSWRTWVL